MVVREELCARKEPMSQKVLLYPQITESAISGPSVPTEKRKGELCEIQNSSPCDSLHSAEHDGTDSGDQFVY